MGVAFVRRELVEVAESDRFNGRRSKKAEYVEPIDTGVVGSTSVGCSCCGVGTYDCSEMGDSCLTGAAAGLVPVRDVFDLSSCRE